MDHQRAEHLRKTVTGIAMIGAPLCFIVADTLMPVSGTDAKKIVADAAGNTGRLYAATMIALVGVALLVGAFIGLAHLLHQRRPGMALVGGALGVVGSVGVGIAYSVSGLVLFEAAQPTRNAAAMSDLVHDLFFGSAIPVFAITFLATAAGIVFAVGLYRAKVVAPWSAICLGAAALVAAVANPSGIQPLIVLCDAVLLAGLGSIGWTVLAETDEEWVTTPEFHGFGREAVAAS